MEICSVQCQLAVVGGPEQQLAHVWSLRTLSHDQTLQETQVEAAGLVCEVLGHFATLCGSRVGSGTVALGSSSQTEVRLCSGGHQGGGSHSGLTGVLACVRPAYSMCTRQKLCEQQRL